MAWIDRESGLLLWGLIACAAHELGHIAAALLMGVYPDRLTLSAVGAELSLRNRTLIPYWKDLLIVLAGPLANLLFGLIAVAADLWLPAFLNFGIGVFNLLPVLPLDGGRILFDALSVLVEAPWPERILRVTAGLCIGVLLGAGAIVAMEYANGTLLVTSVWLLLCVMKKGENLN